MKKRSKPVKDRCYVCHKPVKIRSDFIWQTITNSSHCYDPYILPALPVEETAYWVCSKNGCNEDE